MGRVILTVPSEAGVHAARFHLGKGGHMQRPWKTVLGEAGVAWLFNNEQAQRLLLYYFYAYSTCPLNSCWLCCMS